jgi:hypothetical protein
MSGLMKDDGYGPDGWGVDVRLSKALQSLDPATEDPNYWFRFRSWVMTGAARELARRRLIAQVTVGDVMTSWARMVVPAAVLAAALAGVLLIRAEAATNLQPMELEETAANETSGESVPLLLAPDATEGVVAFAEIF